VSSPEHKRSEEVDPKSTPAKDAAAKSDAPPPAPKTGLNYVFKIAPADPKNSFDFEDVADK